MSPQNNNASLPPILDYDLSCQNMDHEQACNKTSENDIPWPVIYSQIDKTSNLALAAVDDVTPPLEWAVKTLETILDLTIRFLIQCANVADFTGLCGLIVLRIEESPVGFVCTPESGPVYLWSHA